MNENNNIPQNNNSENKQISRRPSPRPQSAADGAAQRPQRPRVPVNNGDAGAVKRPASHGDSPVNRPVNGNSPVNRPASAGGAPAKRPAPAQRPANPGPSASNNDRNGQPVKRVAPSQPGDRRPATAARPPMQRKPAQNPAEIKRDAVPVHPQRKAVPTPVAKKAAEPKTANPPSPTSNINTGETTKKKTTLSKAGAEMMSSAVKAIIYMVSIFVVAIFLSIIIIRVGNDVFALVKSDEVIDITIPEDATINDVGDILHENSIISFPGLFAFYGNIKSDDGVFIAGDYSVSPSMSYDDLRAEFKPKPVTGTSWITIPEGYTVDEIISLMVSYGIGDRETYIDVINNYEFDYWFVKEIPDDPNRHYRLEGYLFPDTYEFYNSSSEITVINKLLARFDEVFVQAYRDRAAELGMSVDDIITIASLIEKEAGTAADYRYVSSVFHNRLKAPGRFPKLESDATTVYAMQLDNKGVRPEEISADQIRNYDSPYNSYKNNGLIPGAIANPSASAIRYALYPTDSNYYFFVAGPGGKTYFAATQTEHDNNIAMIKQQMAQMGQE